MIMTLVLSGLATVAAILTAVREGLMFAARVGRYNDIKKKEEGKSGGDSEG